MPVSMRFVLISFCFNRLLNILIDYHGLRGSFSSIINRLCLCFNRLHISAFGLCENDRNLLELLASVPIVVVGFTFIKEFVSTRTRVYLIHSDKGYRFNGYAQI